ncbi:ATP-binding cassette domain-containing protein [Enterococcus columbae]|uniref:ABC transmembrane type-1 domain-containing protein n=1 Tax=Enterococcus columbae DSM 7374 = ATCC 51263 TaxID=1121865 RepID=S0KHT7_9ENTE|nr:ABC transporter ATP-binding protein [Enterococcus columbae]EOT44359.1 hypothetical protein OMW_00415 [Enterococcus columbae DSM 7374 = ATCC 51263]EOW84517.1 hypothetical protein I568_01013 [Enterococcus columbae DSM 7374 = ATCC 51263]OJG21264.1 hypothetical protein RR47_GL001437 [Enterococcus columbae DSM 7374 = ATCC 51263]
MKWINQNIKNKKILVFQIILSLSVVAMELSLPYIEGMMINQLIAKNVVLLYKLLFILVIAFILRMLVSYFSAKINYSYIPQKSIATQNRFVKDFYLKDTFAISKNSPAYLHDRISNDIESFIKYYYSIIPLIIGEGTVMIYVLIFVYNLNKIFFSIFLLLMFIYIIIHLFSQSKLISLGYRLMEMGNHLYGRRTSLYQRLIEIKAKETMQFEYERLQSLSRKLNLLIDKNFICKYFVSSSKLFFSFIIQVVFFVMGGSMIFSGQLTIGYFITVMQYFWRLLTSLDNMMEFGDEYRKMLVAKNRLLELCDLPAANVGEIVVKEISSIAFNDVNIMINGKALYIQPLTFSLTKNNIYQLIGKNGAGKTSLLLTLVGVYKQNYTGEILLNGQQLSSINDLALRNDCISYMLQNEYMQDILVEEYLTTFLTIAEVEKLLDSPTFKPIFTGEKFNLRKKYQSKMSELSGGERQIIQFFVTITKPNTTLLLLDETFANVDSFFDNQLPALFDDLKKNKIIVLITHRMIQNLAQESIFLSAD